jgi:hypothetical protein
MGDARHVRRIVRRLWPRFGGALLTVCAVILVERKIAELGLELHEVGGAT